MYWKQNGESCKRVQQGEPNYIKSELHEARVNKAGTNVQHPRMNRIYIVASTPLSFNISTSENCTACFTQDSGHPLGEGGEGNLCQQSATMMSRL